MGLFQRIQTFLSRLFTTPISETNIIQQQADQHQKLKSALVNLIFQRKQTEVQLQRATAQLKESSADLEQAASENRDDLAIHLMQQIESLQTESQFLTSHLEKIEKDIELAKQTEIELVQKIQTTKRQYSSLVSRQKILKARKSVHQQIHSGSPAHEQDLLARVQDKIVQLEAENEVLDATQPWQTELDKMRDGRKSVEYSSKLLALKSKIKGKQLTYSGTLKTVLN